MTGTTGTPAGSRVDAELVRRGLARSRRHAAELVAAGRVAVAGRPVAKPSAAVEHGADVVVAPGDPGEAEYASRAGFKLAGVLGVLDEVPVRDTFCADLGASTGGFTDVLLSRGAAHVVAIDVGHGQLVQRLRDDARVTVVEGKNVRGLVPADLDRAPGLVTGDLSFISLTLVVPAIAGVLAPGGQAILLVKPQFEVGRERLGKGGVVRDPARHAAALTAVARAAEGEGLRVRGIVPSPLPGPSGNREFFLWLTAGDGGAAAGPRELSGAVTAAVVPDSAVRLYGVTRDVTRRTEAPAREPGGASGAGAAGARTEGELG